MKIFAKSGAGFDPIAVPISCLYNFVSNSKKLYFNTISTNLLKKPSFQIWNNRVDLSFNFFQNEWQKIICNVNIKNQMHLHNQKTLQEKIRQFPGRNPKNLYKFYRVSLVFSRVFSFNIGGVQLKQSHFSLYLAKTLPINNKILGEGIL